MRIAWISLVKARFRAKNGLDTNFDTNDDLIKMLSDRLALLENKSGRSKILDVQQHAAAIASVYVLVFCSWGRGEN